MITGDTFFGAPWSATLKVLTTFSVVILAGVAVLFATVFPRDLLAGVPFTLAMFIVLTTLLGSALFMVRGYEVDSGNLLIRRLLWSTVLSLSELKEAWSDPTAMARSLRLFGNGGLFVFAGLFWNRKLGKYRAFATLPRNSVVLKFPRRSVVVTPESPVQFLAAIARSCPHANVRRSAP